MAVGAAETMDTSDAKNTSARAKTPKPYPFAKNNYPTEERILTGKCLPHERRINYPTEERILTGKCLPHERRKSSKTLSVCKNELSD